MLDDPSLQSTGPQEQARIWRDPLTQNGKESSHINKGAALGLVKAKRFAESAGVRLPLNTLVSVTFRGSAVFLGGGEPTARETARCREEAIRTVMQLAQRRQFTTAYVWALERSHGRGLHMHMLCRLPEHIHPQLREALERAMQRTFRWPQQQVQPDHVPVLVSDNCLNIFESGQALLYLLKGIDPLVTDFRRGNGDGASWQGRILGKRVGVAHNIGRSAQRQSGWRYVVTGADLDAEAIRQRVKAEVLAGVVKHFADRQGASGGEAVGP